jgi:Uma2 family endonuclease
MTVVVEQPLHALDDGVRRKRWTREEIAFLDRKGLLKGEHWELIEGELLNKMGKKWRHTAALLALANAMRRVFGDQRVITEPGIDVHPEDNPTSEPEPDLVVTTVSAFHLRHNPRPPDMSLLVEVSDSTLRYDRTTKARLYARAGIQEYWVMDAVGRRLFVHRGPSADRYNCVVEYTEDETISPLAAPSQPILISDLFGPALPPDAE